MPSDKTNPIGPVLTLTPTGRDGESIASLLAMKDLDVRRFNSVAALCAFPAENAGAAIIADEALRLADSRKLAAWVEGQPQWSDIPVVILTQRFGGRQNGSSPHLNLPLTNVMYLERPTSALSLVSAVETALRARRRQMQVRDYLVERTKAAEELERSKERLRFANENLEAQVHERTRQLRKEMSERQRAESALSQAQRMEAVGRLTGGIAHDFNNLLMATIGNLQLVARKLTPDHAAMKFAENAISAANRGVKLTSQLLAFSRIQKLDLAPVAIDGLVSGTVDLIKHSLGQEVTVQTSLGADGLNAIADPHQLELAILNLATNARDAMKQQGQLTIATRKTTLEGEDGLPDGDYVEISVIDTGAGMSDETISHVFEPFFTTKGVGKGTGLGLAQVYGTARQCGGTVKIKSKVGEGTTVSILLPVTAQPVVSVTPPAPVAESQMAAGRSVLVIDDDPQVRQSLVDALIADGFTVHEATDGKSGLTKLASVKVDALVVDFAMPGMNGADVAREAQAQQPDLPVVLVTGYADTAALDRIASAHVLRKPFRLEELRKTLEDALG
jgi:signal transduction histidine kinase